MKKLVVLLILLGFVLFMGCEAPNPSQPSLNIQKNQLVLRKVVAIGNSLTAGYQFAGMRRDFQEHSYPYYIAKQLGIQDKFQMPWIESPGLGTSDTGDPTLVATPLSFDATTGEISFDTYSVADVPGLLSNVNLSRPYDNLAVPGAKLVDLIEATTSESSSNPHNPFYDMILRNPALGNMTMLHQATLLNPSLLFVWIGNNDVLGAAVNGTDSSEYITDLQTFTEQYTEMLNEIRNRLPNTVLVGANIPYVTDIPYVNTLDAIFAVSPLSGTTDPVPVVFAPVPDSTTGGQKFVPVDFGGGLYIPLVTAETGVAHVLLPGLAAYQQGIGVPDSSWLVAHGIPAAQASLIVAGMKASGLNPTGIPIPGNLTLTATETANIKTAVDNFNSVISSLAQQFHVALMDANALLTKINEEGVSGLSGKYVYNDPARTAFSLDGVHPNNAGYAIVANAFIEVVNTATGLSIPELNPADYAGQYVGGSFQKAAPQALEGVKALFSYR